MRILREDGSTAAAFPVSPGTLLGDAAHCNATFGGAGTSLALIGAYILAGELGMGSDIGNRRCPPNL